ncbi:MAG: YdiU family protein [Planctomycetes bacterium]|nr:YdiU family protein [Planctomycetota bacterium]
MVQPPPAERFHRRFLDELPGDPATAAAPRAVVGAAWSRVQPTPVAAPHLLAFSHRLAAELGLAGGLELDPSTAAVLGGNALWPGMDPYAANYGGHQFGHWAGQLGDGRAIVLGELRRPDGAIAELQLKGAGPTAYSRRGDGRAVLRSSIREFLCSEAMHALGVPTTRALSLVATGDQVVRDMFYDGNARPEPGAIVCRVAPSFLRFGNYELPSARGDVALLRTLVDFTLRHHFPELGTPARDAYAALLRAVAERTARLIAHWQAIGFVHGVMNTDNLSMLGLTIDYGPYGWIDDFDLGWTPNTTDAAQRRYAFGNQPTIGLWNVMRLGEALLPLVDGAESVVEEALAAYDATYSGEATRRFAAKLGLTFSAGEDDGALLRDLFTWLQKTGIDMTLFFRSLSRVVVAAAAPSTLPEAIVAACYREPDADDRAAGVSWLQRWWRRTRRESRPAAELAVAMDRVNPRFVLRNWLAQEAIDAAHGGSAEKVARLLEVMARPFDEQPQHADLAAKRPDWARDKPGCSALSCSS